jgi:hypothetical protein
MKFKIGASSIKIDSWKKLKRVSELRKALSKLLRTIKLMFSIFKY